MGWVPKPPPGVLILVCGSLHSLAKKAYERTLTAASEQTPHQPDALSAIILSVVSLEALIGELVEVVRGLLPNCPEDSRNRGKALIDALELIEEGRGQLALKFQVAKFILSGSPYQTGASPYQNFDLLLEIRNGLVHPKAFSVKSDESGSAVDPLRKFREKLRSLEIIAEIPKENVMAPFSTWVQTKAAARWACNTAVAMVHSLFEAPAEDPLVQTLRTILASSFIMIP
jgi:hypothetical protein